MKLIILQEKLKEGVEIVESISTKSLSLPVLNNIFIKTEKNFLNLTATDLEIGIKWWTLAKIEKEGAITIPAHILSTFLNFLPNKKVTLELKNSSLVIECENYHTTLKGFNPEDFPIIPQIGGGEFVLVESRSFCQGLSQLADIAIPSTAKPEISGIFFVFQKDFIKMAATDSFRLGEKTFYYNRKTPSPLSKEYALILPQKAAKEIINIFGEREGELRIYFSPNQVLFESPMVETSHPQTQLISRLIEGEYPNYQEIIPKKYETQIVFQRNEFLNQIKSAALFSGKVNEVKLKINPKKEKVELFSQNPDLGEYRSHLSGKIKGKEIEISFNHRFLSDGLLNIKSPEVVFELTGSEGPGVLKPAGDPSYLYVVMPIKAS
jgi:DNA polymerase-3 subunit beta